ncbi:MAG: bifunctional hydroxymethylpyrimidine kinase/phosphomethylpyrimidine kinase [Bilophila sp.]
MPTPPSILTIAGSDSGGGAGIQADIKTITVLGGYAMSVITALTAQNGLGVDGIHAPEPGFVSRQLKSVRDGFPIAAAKTGMLFSAGIIEAVEAGLRGRSFPLVVDPVCVSQSGQRLLREDAVNALKWHILPGADLLTPNRPEAELLTGMKINTVEDVDAAARALLRIGSKAVLIKGGHFDNTSAFTDWLALPDQPLLSLSQPAVKTTNNHGTGCTLSAAIATFLGFGMTIQDAITHAQHYLNHCLHHAYAPGLGAGPPNHASWIVRRVETP